MKTPLKCEFANENPAGMIVEISNDLKIGDDGWAQIAPVGDHVGMALIDDTKGGYKKVKAIQRIDKASCDAMALEFSNSSKGVKKYFAGRPIFVGHPDVPGYESKYPDKSLKGLFTDLQSRDDGLYGKPAFTNEGSDLVEGKKYRALSGRWNAEPAGDDKGTPIFRPSVFLSAGLTNQPNLPVQLLNESEHVESPAERADRLSNTAHDSSKAAYSATRKARSLPGKAEVHTDAFHQHAAASSAHCDAANCRITMKNDEAKAAGRAPDGDGDEDAIDHQDMADFHQKAALKHYRAAKKAGAAPTMANDAEKVIETLANSDLVPLGYVAATKQVIQLTSDRANLLTEKTTITNEKETIKTELEKTKGTLDTAKTETETVRGQLNAATTERDAAKSQFANERVAYRNYALDKAVRDGRISFAQRTAWDRRLSQEANFANELKELDNIISSKVKTHSITIDRGGRKIELATPSQRVGFFNEACEEIAKLKGWDRKKHYDKIFQEVMRVYPQLAEGHPNGARR